MDGKPLIFVSNDDSIESDGIRVLVDVLKPIGKVVVVAPTYPQSAKSHSITIDKPLRIKTFHGFGDDVVAFSVDGSPADCVKIGRVKIVQEYLGLKEPNILVSGVNHGSNTSLAVLYSGTVAAAIEGTIAGIPSIAFSLCEPVQNPHFSHVTPYIKTIVDGVLSNGLPKNITLNVNLPIYKQNAPIKGVKIVRQAKAGWVEQFDERIDPDKKKYYWLTGDFVNYEDGNEDNDEWAVNNNFVSIVPCMCDLTSKESINWLKEKFNFNNIKA